MTKSFERETIIEATSPWKPFDFAEIARYRDLFYFKILNGYKAQHRQTVLSYLWVILEPLVNIAFFAIVFGRLAGIDTGDTPYAAFNASVMAGWSLLSVGLSGAVLSLNAEADLLQKIYFPRIYIPVIPTIVNFPNFLIQLFCTGIVLAYFRIYPGWQIIFIIPVILCNTILVTAAGLLLSTFFVQLKDLAKVFPFFMRFYQYSLPIVYPLSLVPEKYRWLYELNPGVPIIEGMRASLLGTPMPWFSLGVTTLCSLVILYIGAVVFRLREPNIVDAI